MYDVYNCICISICNKIQIWTRLIVMQVGAVQPELLRRNSIWKRWKYKIMEMLPFLLQKLLPAESRKSWHLRNCRNQTFIHSTWQRFIRDKSKRFYFFLLISNINFEFCKEISSIRFRLIKGKKFDTFLCFFLSAEIFYSPAQFSLLHLIINFPNFTENTTRYLYCFL